MAILPTTQTGFSALSPQQQKDHRAKIGVRARAILGGFWRDSDTPDAEQALEIEGWMDVLQNCSHSEIRNAWADYQKSGPRSKSGRLIKPDAGALYLEVMKARPKPKPIEPEPEEPSEPRATPEQKAQILEQAGYRLNEHGGIVSPGSKFGD